MLSIIYLFTLSALKLKSDIRKGGSSNTKTRTMHYSDCNAQSYRSNTSHKIHLQTLGSNFDLF